MKNINEFLNENLDTSIYEYYGQSLGGKIWDKIKSGAKKVWDYLTSSNDKDDDNYRHWRNRRDVYDPYLYDPDDKYDYEEDDIKDTYKSIIKFYDNHKIEKGEVLDVTNKIVVKDVVELRLYISIGIFEYKVSNFNFIDTSKVKEMVNVFVNIRNKGIDISEWSFNKAKTVHHMFSNCPNLKTVGDTSKWKISASDKDEIKHKCPVLNI